MDWQAFIALLKRHPKKTVAGIIFIASTAFSAGSYMLYVEQCHAQTQTNQAIAAANAKSIQAILAVAEADAKAKKESWRKVIELCLAGTINDKAVCAEAEAALK